MKNSIKIIQTASFALLLSLSLTACNKSQTEDVKAESSIEDLAETENSDEKQAIDTSTISASQELAEFTVKNSSIALSLFMAKPDITDKQKSCIKQISLNSVVPEIQEKFEEKFTDEELQKALDMYNNPDIRAMIEYGLQTAKMMVGVEIDNPLPEPENSEKAIIIIEEFSQTELGKRLENFEDANIIVKTEIDNKIKSCGIEPTLDIVGN